MRGRKPNPAGLRAVREAERAHGDDPTPPAARSKTTREPRPSCPSWLSPEQRREWRLICRELGRKGILDSADRNMIADLAIAVDNLRRTTEYLNVNGSFYWVVIQGSVKKCPGCAGKAALGQVECKACRSKGVIRGPSRRERHKAPEVMEQRNAQDMIIRNCAALGLEPTSRYRLKLVRPDKKKAGPERPSLRAYMGG